MKAEENMSETLNPTKIMIEPIKNRLQWFYSIWFELLDVISMVVLSPLIAMLNDCCNVTRNIEIRILNISFLVNIDF